MQRIQDQAGVSRGTLTHHFASIHLMLVAAIGYIADQQYDRISLIANRHPVRSAADAVELMYPAQSGPLFNAGLELWIAARTDESLRQALLPSERKLGQKLRELLTSALTPVQIDTLFALFRGLAVTRILRPDSKPERDILDGWAKSIDVSSEPSSCKGNR